MTYPIHSRAFDVPPDETRLVAREQRDKIRTEVSSLAAQLSAATELGMPLVYGAVREESPVVKIGTTTRLAGRKGRLRRMPGCHIVAITLGGYDVEREVHRRLDASRVTVDLRGPGVTEHFRITDEVVEWINETRDAIALDPITADELLGYSA